MNKQLKIAVLWGLGICLLAGCLVSGTLVKSLKIDEFVSKSDETFSAQGVDLNGAQWWKDHKDDIKNVSDVRLRAKIENLSENSATGQVYFSTDSTYESAAEVLEAAKSSDAFIVFGGMNIPAGETFELFFTESVNYRQNLDKALKLIEGGKFFLYALTPEEAFELHVTDVYIMITFDAGPS